MKIKQLIAFIIALVIGVSVYAQEKKEVKIKVPANVKAAFVKKYPAATKVNWELEKGNYEANWGGKNGEANAVVYTPAAAFVEIVKAIPIASLPRNVAPFIKSHFKTNIQKAGKGSDANGKTFFEAEIKVAKDVIFDKNGVFIRID